MEIKGATPRIVSDDLFYRAQELLKENEALASRNTKRKYLLSGVIFCKQCGWRYTANTAVSRQKYETPYYRCPSSMKGFSPNKIPCKNRHWNGRVLDNAIWDTIRELLIEPENVLIGLSVLEEDSKHIDTFTAEIRDIERKLKYLDDEQGKLLDQSLRGFPKDIIIKENEKINKSRENLGARKSNLENKVFQAKTTVANMDSIQAFCKLAQKNIDNFTFEDKRLALRALQVKVVVDREKITLEGAIPEASSFGNLQPTM